MELIDQYVPDFKNYLLNKVNINFENYFLLLNEENVFTNANSFVSTLISFYLKNNKNVILAASQESLNHYSMIMKKFGLNLGNNDKFCFLDLFYSPVKSIIREELPLCESFPSTYNPNRSKFYYSNITINSEADLKFETIFQILESQIQKFSSQENRTVLIFDNLSLLPNSGRNLFDEINNLMKFTSDKTLDLVINLNKEISGDEIYNYLYNLSDFEIEFKQNESGFSKDIDGQIKLYLNSSNIKTWTLRYTIKENGMSFFPHVIV